MNDAAREWVDVLFSGHYKQGAKYMTEITEDGLAVCWSVLGVACDVYMAYFPLVIKDYKGWRYYDGERAILPRSVQRWLGLSHRTGFCDEGCLTIMESNGASFEEMASFIESEPEGLFVE
jgi:hypothetical protein